MLLFTVLQTSGSASTTGGGGSGTPVFHIYTDNNVVTGGPGIRATSSATCATMQTANFPAFTCTNHLMVISYTAGDDLASAAANHSIPTGRALTSSTAMVVAADWPTFLAGPPLSLQAAGVAVPVPTPFFWTSSNAGGTINGANNCTNNTDNTAGSNGSHGAINSTNAAHIAFATAQPCNGGTNTAYLMCICWN